jgi:hypothetical protein
LFIMKNIKRILTSGLVLIYASCAIQVQSQSAGASVAKKVGVYVYPAKGQTPEQQEKDQSDCYTWAVQQSGYDPINPTVVQAQQVQKGPDGSAIRGSAGGAVTGAAIGAIAGDAGKGAAIGAVSGAVLGHRRGRMHQSMEQSQANASASQQTQSLIDGFKKAFSVCLEGKDYTVK